MATTATPGTRLWDDGQPSLSLRGGGRRSARKCAPLLSPQGATQGAIAGCAWLRRVRQGLPVCFERGRVPTSKRVGSHPRAPSGSFKGLCEAYYGSAEFKLLESRTARVRRSILDDLCREHGLKPVRLVEVRHIRAIRDAKADRPEAANGTLKALRQVFAFGVASELLDRNACKDVPYLKSGSQGFHTWTPEEVAQFEARHPIGTKARLALALLLYTCQRRSDVVLFGRQHVRAGHLSFTQEKGKKKNPVSLRIPVIPALREIIDASPCGDLTFLVTAFGRGFSAAGFGNKFRVWCDEAGLPSCAAHGLRKASATRLAELGCSKHEIMAVTGHRTSKEVARYTRAARQGILADSAMARMSADETANRSVPPDQSVTESGTKSKAKGFK